MESGWQRVYVNNVQHRVEIVKAVLEENNIPSVLIDKRDSTYVSIGDMELYVPEKDAILAKVIIEQHQL